MPPEVSLKLKINPDVAQLMVLKLSELYPEVFMECFIKHREPCSTPPPENPDCWVSLSAKIEA